MGTKNKGGNTSFLTIVALGGAGADFQGRTSEYWGVTGGFSAEVTTGYTYIQKGTPASITIGAGGASQTSVVTDGSLNTGYKGYPPSTMIVMDSIHDRASGGLGGNNGTIYGNGGGGSGYRDTKYKGLAVGNAQNGSAGTGLTRGGNGGDGVVILEYFNPEVTGA